MTKCYLIQTVLFLVIFLLIGIPLTRHLIKSKDWTSSKIIALALAEMAVVMIYFLLK